MAIKIKLTERQQKLAAGELDIDEPLDDAEALKDAGFDFVDSDDNSESGSGKNGNGDDGTDDDVRPSGEYIDDGIDGSDSQASSQSDDDSGSGLPDWADDRVRSYAESYGLTDDDLATFDSLEALQRFGTFVDRRFAEAVSSNDVDSQSGGTSGRGKDAEGDDSDSEGKKSSQKKPDLLERLKPLDRKRYEDAKYGEAELELVDQLNGAIEAIRQIVPGFMQQQEQAAEQQNAQRMQEFHQTLDEIDSNVYGRVYKEGKPVGKLGEAFDSNRRAVLETMDRLSSGIIADATKRGVAAQLPPISVLAQRASAIVLGTLASDKTGGKGRTSGTSVDQVSAQSRRRRPTGTGGTRHSGTVGRGSGSGKPQTEADEVKALANNPQIASFFKKAQRDNGVA